MMFLVVFFNGARFKREMVTLANSKQCLEHL